MKSTNHNVNRHHIQARIPERQQVQPTTRNPVTSTVNNRTQQQFDLPPPSKDSSTSKAKFGAPRQLTLEQASVSVGQRLVVLLDKSPESQNAVAKVITEFIRDTRGLSGRALDSRNNSEELKIKIDKVRLGEIDWDNMSGVKRREAVEINLMALVVLCSQNRNLPEFQKRLVQIEKEAQAVLDHNKELEAAYEALGAGDPLTNLANGKQGIPGHGQAAGNGGEAIQSESTSYQAYVRPKKNPPQSQSNPQVDLAKAGNPDSDVSQANLQAKVAAVTANQNQQINNVQAQQDRDTKAQAFKQNMATEAMTAQMKEAETTQRTLHEQRQTALDKIEQRLSK